MPQTTRDQIDAAVRVLIAEIGLPENFVEGLLGGDDWSFVVKLHALIEAGLTHALVAHVGRDDARDVFANLDLNNTKTGKIAFAGIFLDLRPEDRRIMRALSEMRNQIVHDVRNVNLDLNAHVGALGLDGRRNFVKAFGYVEAGSDETLQELDQLLTRYSDKVRLMVLRSAMFLLAVLQLQVDTVRAKQESIDQRLKIAELLKSKSWLIGGHTKSIDGKS